MRMSRRALLQAGLVATSAPLLGSRRLAAQQAADKPAVVLLYLDGGYNCLFSSADSCVAEGAFGVTASNVRDAGNGLVVDAGTFGTLPDTVLAHMATVGVQHGVSDHVNGTNIWFNQDGYGASYPLLLAGALGGTASFRCVSFSPVHGAHPATGGVSLSIIPDLSSALLGAGAAPESPVVPGRTEMGRGLERALQLSRRAFTRSPSMLREYYEGLHTAKNALLAPPTSLDWPEIASAYGIGSSLTIDSFASRFAAAELMIRAGSDVIVITDRAPDALVGFGWDSHGDNDGNSVRTMMANRLPTLRTFFERTLAMEGRNVVTAITGEFARSVFDSGHASGISATVVGKRIRTGTTGRAIISGPDYRLPEGTPGVDAFYAFLVEAAGGASSTFGDNPHQALLA